ncbi:PGR5-like protein [Striga asiatica]|uniref:PGR5-like protein n=1 Tax=Striga asiatica TaxID=4170 RepID=A0A5A7PSA6_STRAF|nr:PGR5-like protein [Striga asiatica]
MYVGQEDPSQVLALASVWILILAFGSLACLVPIIYTIAQSYQDGFNSGLPYTNQASALESLATLNATLFMLFGSLIGYPIASASVGALQGLWRNDLVALKGACPNCGEEKAHILQVFAFVRSDRSTHSPHRVQCHVCESSLEFRTKVEVLESAPQSPGRRWVYGRIYLIRPMGRRQRWA